MDLKHLNQEHLANAINEKERGYMDSVMALISAPIFIEAIDKDLENAKGERKKSLESARKQNETQMESHTESLELVGKMLDELYKLKK